MYCLPPWMTQVERLGEKISAAKPQPQDNDATAQSNDNDAVSTATNSALCDDTGSTTLSIATVPTDNISSTKQKQKKNNDQGSSCISPPLSNKQKRREKKERMKNSPDNTTSKTNSSRRRIFVTRSLPLPNSLKNHLIHQNKILRHVHPSIRRGILLHLLHLLVLLFFKMIPSKRIMIHNRKINQLPRRVKMWVQLHQTMTLQLIPIILKLKRNVRHVYYVRHVKSLHWPRRRRRVKSPRNMISGSRNRRLRRQGGQRDGTCICMFMYVCMYVLHCSICFCYAANDMWYENIKKYVSYLIIYCLIPCV